MPKVPKFKRREEMAGREQSSICLGVHKLISCCFVRFEDPSLFSLFGKSASNISRFAIILDDLESLIA
jgi:hypothetical protein